MAPLEGHRFLHHLDVIEVHHAVDLDTVIAQKAIRVALDGKVVVELDEIASGEVFGRDPRAPCQRIRGRGSNGHPLAPPRNHGQLPGFLRITHQAQIGAIFQHGLVNILGLGELSAGNPAIGRDSVAARADGRCTTPSDPLARRSRVSAEDLAGRDFVEFDDDLPIKRDTDRFLRDHGIEVNRVMHFDNVQMVKEAVALSGAIAILPERVMRAEVQIGRLAAIPLDAALVRPVGSVHRRKREAVHRAAELFLSLLQEGPGSAEAPR